MIKSARIKFEKLKGETPKAFLIQIIRDEFWIPKSLSRNFTLNNKLGGHVELPTFIINKIFNIDINTDLPDFVKPTWIVEKHIPETKKAIQDNTIEELKR